MAIPYGPTLQEIARTALRSAGQPAPSQGMIEEAKSILFAQVKNDIKLTAPTHPLLETEEIVVTVQGVRSVAQPTKAHLTKSVLLLTGPDAWRGTATAGGGVGSINLANDFSEDAEQVIGKIVATLSGSGSLQYRHASQYDDSTKLVSVSPDWAVSPSSSTGYVLVNHKRELLQTTAQVMNYDDYRFAGKGEPRWASLEGEVLWLDVSPDKVYPLLWTYYVDIDQLDESSDQLRKILREWLSVILKGITVKAMEVYDDNRYETNLQVYHVMLERLKAETLEIRQTVPYDPIYSWYS